LVRASDKAAEELRTACPRTVPVTQIGRVEAMEQRLAALHTAVSTVQPALEKLYATLNDEQKSRFNRTLISASREG
jgi:hypothetical protein